MGIQLPVAHEAMFFSVLFTAVCMNSAFSVALAQTKDAAPPRTPAMSYINHKFNDPAVGDGKEHIQVNFFAHRACRPRCDGVRVRTWRGAGQSILASIRV
jgi:hypothetical protein